MKNLISLFFPIGLLLFMFSCTPPVNVLKLDSPETNRRDIEAREMAYLIECIKSGRTVDSLKEWKIYGKDTDTPPFSFNYKEQLAFFTPSKNSSNQVLESVTYCRKSLQRTMFSNENSNDYKITKETKFKVWMSKDRLSIYFCMINPDKIDIWILTNGNWIYSYASTF